MESNSQQDGQGGLDHEVEPGEIQMTEVLLTSTPPSSNDAGSSSSSAKVDAEMFKNLIKEVMASMGPPKRSAPASTSGSETSDAPPPPKVARKASSSGTPRKTRKIPEVNKPNCKDGVKFISLVDGKQSHQPKDEIEIEFTPSLMLVHKRWSTNGEWYVGITRKAEKGGRDLWINLREQGLRNLAEASRQMIELLYPESTSTSERDNQTLSESEND